MQLLRSLTTLMLVSLIGGCSTVDFDAPKSVSHAMTDTADTGLGKLFEKHAHRPSDQSGFYVVTDSIDALAIRLLLARSAERSIDAQYYMINNDIIGKVFFESLLRAADRGVRVRLLIDDINTGGMEHKLAGLSDHPNIELRLFNPFANRSFRAFDAWDLGRLNRRMHNKSFTVDNQATIIGGRNIATEYFAANEEYNFGDLDTFAIGPVVRETSRMFDSYWNHRHAVPYTQLSGQQPDRGERLAEVRETLSDNLDYLRDTAYAGAIRESFEAFLTSDDKELTWAPYRLVFDSPDKSVSEEKAEEIPGILTPLLRSVDSAEHSVLLVSPYFVPRKPGIEWLAGLRKDGVNILVVTNSLASSDHILVHGGYVSARKALLPHGIKFCEVRGDLHIEGTETAGARGSKSSLHTKAFIVDRRYFFMGSFNWDPRSADINTELGIIIDSPEIASQLQKRMLTAAPDVCYTPFLNEDGKLRWREKENGEIAIINHEPDTTFFHRLGANMGRLLPIKNQL